LLHLACAALGGWILAWFALPFAVPLPESLSGAPPASPVILDRHGTPIHRLTLPDFSRGRPVALRDIPREFIDCTLAAEDRRFYGHGGVDLLATARAAFDWLRLGRAVSGASTITQQLVKISSPPAPRSISTKVREALAARRLEMTHSKDWILAAYLNRLGYGRLRRGSAEAARYFFQKPLGDLSLGECALLAGLPQAPSRLDPIRHPERALARRSVVLDRLARNFPYPKSRIDRARAEPLRLRPVGDSTVHAPWLAASLSRMAGPDGADGGGDIRTTLDLPLQRDVEAIVREELSRLAGTNARHAAVVVLDNATGDILALVNSGNWSDPLGGQLNGALLPRSPGSALKPFTYLLAFEQGGAFPGTIIADVPTRFRTEDGLDAPENYDHTYRGPVTIRVALASSLNVAAMRQLNRLGGPEPLFKLLTRLGIDTLGPDPAPYGLGLTIGNAPVRLLGLTNAYATLARGGTLLPPRILLPPSANDPQVDRVSHPSTPDFRPSTSSFFSPTSAFLIADILSDPEARAMAFGPAASIRLPFRCAVKTGTSSDFHDNWCLGFTPQTTVGVWVGNFEFNPMTGVSGITGAGPVFRRVMARAHRDRPATWFMPPADLARIEIDPRTGKRTDDSLPPSVPRVAEWCPRDRFPLTAASSDYDARGRVRLDATYREWFDSAPLADRSRFTLDPGRPAPRPLRVLAPSPDATYFLDPELPTGGCRLRLATNLPGLAEWSSPTLEIEPTRPEPTALLVPGDHILVATDPRTGRRHEIKIHVESL
jgi:penicillin-binding protein 1C